MQINPPSSDIILNNTAVLLLNVSQVRLLQPKFLLSSTFQVPISKRSEYTAAQSKLNAFIELLNGFKITELARTGITGLARGTASLK